MIVSQCCNFAARNVHAARPIAAVSPSQPTTASSADDHSRNSPEWHPRILLVTPEICDSSLLASDGGKPLCVKAGGLADVSALLLDSLTEAGADVHVAIPNFRSLMDPGPNGHSHLLHLCEDREFCYRQAVYEGDAESNLRAALAFQRDVIQYVIPHYKPDLVHCHDWMTGLIPAAARSMGIPSIFTIHNLHDEHATLAHIEDRGIDSAAFWNHLYFDRFPGTYEETRASNPVSLLASGILAADRVNTVSGSFLNELASGSHHASWQVADAVRGKIAAGHASGILNSLPGNRSPKTDPSIVRQYDADTVSGGKAANKAELQRVLGLDENPSAPVFFWPSRLDPVQKGCDLLAAVLQEIVSAYQETGIQIVFIADGPSVPTFEDIIHANQLHRLVAVKSFHDPLSRLGYAASDFILMPSSFEPCGLAQMIALRYASLPVVHTTGGLRDTITPLDVSSNIGNGFPFDDHDAAGLRWAIDRAMDFHHLPAEVKISNLQRIMTEADTNYRPSAMTDRYLAIYQDLVSTRRT